MFNEQLLDGISLYFVGFNQMDLGDFYHFIHLLLRKWIYSINLLNIRQQIDLDFESNISWAAKVEA